MVMEKIQLKMFKGKESNAVHMEYLLNNNSDHF